MRKLLTIIATMIMCNAYGNETVYWVVDNAVSSVSSCEANGNITTPPIPQKTGFRFIGWKEGTNPSFFSTTSYKNYYPYSGTGYTYWQANLLSGDPSIKGDWRCSVDIFTNNNYSTSYVPTSSNPSLTGGCGSPSDDVSCTSINTNAKGCWCRLNTIISGGKTVNISGLPWVYYITHSSASICAKSCANGCASRAADNQYDYRLRLLGLK